MPDFAMRMDPDNKGSSVAASDFVMHMGQGSMDSSVVGAEVPTWLGLSLKFNKVKSSCEKRSFMFFPHQNQF
jgi:hypothetical protein